MATIYRTPRHSGSYLAYWQLPPSPFDEPAGGLRFRSSCFAEAEARLHYVIDSKARLAILTGPAGTGKTMLLRELARNYHRQDHWVVLVDTLGLESAELLEQLVVGMGGMAPGTFSVAAAWRELFARLRVNAFQGIHTLFLLDNVDQASGEVHTAILRLVHGGSAGPSANTVVLTAQLVTRGTWAAPFLLQCPLRVELERWNEEDVLGYLSASFQRDVESLFDRPGIDALIRLAEGNPRRLQRIAEMALLAGAADRLERIDAGTVESVDRELTGSSTRN